MSWEEISKENQEKKNLLNRIFLLTSVNPLKMKC